MASNWDLRDITVLDTALLDSYRCTDRFDRLSHADSCPEVASIIPLSWYIEHHHLADQ